MENTHNCTIKSFKQTMNTTFINASKKKFTSFLVILIIGAIFFNYSCNDEANLIGADLIPVDDKIGYYYDTTSLNFTSFIETQKHFRTRNQTSYYIGLVNSTYHGSLTGSVASQFKPNNSKTVFTDATIDSAVLYLSIDTIYGVKNTAFALHAYTLDTVISDDPIYYTSSDISTMYSETNKINTGFRVQGDSLLVLPLDPTFTQYLASHTFLLGDTAFSDSLFKVLFKGIAIIPENLSDMGGQLYKFNTTSGFSKISVFYNDSLSLPYYFSTGNRFGTYNYNLDGSILESLLENQPTENDSLIFLQGFSGVNTKIILTNYISWIDVAKYSIIKAELIVPIFETGESSSYYFPSKLYLAHADSDTTFVSTIDASNSKFFDGKVDLTKNQYRFDISRYMQNLLNGKTTDSCMYIKINNNNYEPNRVVLKSGNNIKLKVTYTKH